MPKTQDMFDVMVPSKYTVKSTGEEKTRWTRVGAAFPRRKGGGYSVRLDFPVAVSEIVLLPPKDFAQKDAPAPSEDATDFPPSDATDFPSAEEDNSIPG